MHHVAAAISLIGGALPMTEALARRELLSAERKVARARATDCGGMMMHSAYEHLGADDELSHARHRLALTATLKENDP